MWKLEKKDFCFNFFVSNNRIQQFSCSDFVLAVLQISLAVFFFFSN